MSDADDVARERDATALGRHYVAGHLEAGDLGTRLDALYAAPDAPARALILADLPRLDAAAPAPVRSGHGWWRRRHGESGAPRPDWLPTTERFLDPTTDRVMRVWVEPGSRTRHYVPDDQS